MAIQLASFLTPKPGASYFILEDVNFRGGMRVVVSEQLRDLIPTTSRKAGMLVWTQDTLKMWQLAVDLLTWEEFAKPAMTRSLKVTTPLETWKIVHPFTNQMFTYNIFDENRNVIIPQSVIPTTENEISFSLGSLCTGFVVVQFLEDKFL